MVKILARAATVLVVAALVWFGVYFAWPKTAVPCWPGHFEEIFMRAVLCTGVPESVQTPAVSVGLVLGWYLSRRRGTPSTG